MVQITCQYTGITFDAASKRQKNHPRVSAILNDAAKGGTYGTACERLNEAREAGMLDINEVIAYVKSGVNAAAQERTNREFAARQEKRATQRAFADARAEREQTNAILRQHGYRWQKVGDEEDMDFAGPNAGGEGYWVLCAPDGRSVSVAEALKEIG